MMIPYGRQEITEEDIAEVVAVLKSDFLTQGPAVPTFECSIQDYAGVNHAVAVNSATSALHIACLALGVSTGDIVWTSPITFVASANCALYCGASIDFVDIDPITLNMSVEALEKKLIDASKTGSLPKVVIPVHMCGLPCDMRKIFELSQQYGFKIIDDASHAIGARYLGSKIGSCQYSDIAILSFHPVKIMTTGEGGMALTNNPELAFKLQLLRSHGITRDSSKMVGENEGGWYYQQIALGYNYRMTDIQAALGNSQLTRVDKYVSVRNEIADFYDSEFKNTDIVLPFRGKDYYSAFHLYIIQLSQSDLRASIFAQFRKMGLGVNVHYIPVHTQPYYKGLGFNKGDFPNAEAYYAKSITIPLYPTMTQQQQFTVANLVKEAIN